MELYGSNLIGYTASAEGEAHLEARDPATDAALGRSFTVATKAEIDRAVTLAATAFPTYRKLSAEARAAFLEQIAIEIIELGDALIARARAETALPEARLVGERGRTVGQLRMFAELVREGSWTEARIDTALPDRKPLPRPDLRRMLIPLGPVAVFGASNFPFAFSVAGGDTASALAAGCPVIVKAHPSHLGTSEMVGRAVLEAAGKCGMPDGVFSLVNGGSEVGVALVNQPLLEAVGFTGSRGAGLALYVTAAARPRPIPVYAEMSSINPVFVLPGALRERGSQIAAGLAQSVTLGVGQFCTNPGLVIGIESDGSFGKFTADVADAAAKAPAATMLNPGIFAAFDKGTEQTSTTPGVERIGQPNALADAGLRQPAPAVFLTSAATFLTTVALSEEVFGPETLAIACGSPAELQAVALGLEGQLTATIHGTTKDLETYGDLVAILEGKVGRLLFNAFPTGVEVSSAMQHGGPFPATTDSRSTSVGTAAIGRFARPICYQDAPEVMLPVELRDGNPRGILRLVDGVYSRVAI